MASKFESGCSLYAKATIDIYFPDGHVCCDLCPFNGNVQPKAMPSDRRISF